MAEIYLGDLFYGSALPSYRSPEFFHTLGASREREATNYKFSWLVKSDSIKDDTGITAVESYKRYNFRSNSVISNWLVADFKRATVT